MFAIFLQISYAFSRKNNQPAVATPQKISHKFYIYITKEKVYRLTRQTKIYNAHLEWMKREADQKPSKSRPLTLGQLLNQSLKNLEFCGTQEVHLPVPGKYAN